MVNKKRVMLVMMISVVIMISVISVSFIFAQSNLEGELPAASDASVTLANSLPLIVSWTAPDADDTIGGIQPWTPTPCTFITVITDGIDTNDVGVDVIVSDDNSDNDLDTTAIVDIQIKDNPSSPTVTVDGSCALVGASIDGDNFATFRCTFNMEFYYIPSANWVIEITATDDAGGSASNSPQQSDGLGSYPYFEYGAFDSILLKDSDDGIDFSVGDDTILWTGIAAISENVEASPDEGVNPSYMTTRNCGNRGVDGASTFFEVTGNYLTGATSGIFMQPNSFSVDDISTSAIPPDSNGPCNAGAYLGAQVLDGVLPPPFADINVLGASLAVGAIGSADTNLYFCLEDIVGTSNLLATPTVVEPIPVDTYTTGASDWDISICTVGPC